MTTDPLSAVRTREPVLDVTVPPDSARAVDPRVAQVGSGRSHPWWRRHRWTRWADLDVTYTPLSPNKRQVHRDVQTRICTGCGKRQMHDPW